MVKPSEYTSAQAETIGENMSSPARLENLNVAVNFTELVDYPATAPFHAPCNYPEYTGGQLDPGNQVYAEVRETLRRTGLDSENFDTPEWNPFKDIVKPGMTVLLKPNTVSHQNESGQSVFAVVTHASVVRPILDYVCIALKGRGKVVVGDSQFLFSQFDAAMVNSQISEVLAWYRQESSIQIQCQDFRQLRAPMTPVVRQWQRLEVEKDPRGYRWVDLGDESYFRDIEPHRLRIAVADPREMYRHHSDGRHEYLFPQAVLDCDAIIHVPKLKTHRRNAVSLCTKSFIGLPSGKQSLPHYRIGAVEEGGDQYIHHSVRKRMCTWLNDRIQSRSRLPLKFVCAMLKKTIWATRALVPFQDDIDEAMWHGNDTIWRTLLDLVRVTYYADKQGRLCKEPQRSQFYFIDGIIGGQKNGPISPDVKHAGVLLAGFSPVAVDAVAGSLMGFNVDRIPQISQGLQECREIRPIFCGHSGEISVSDGDRVMGIEEFAERNNLHFEPHPQWKGYLERELPQGEQDGHDQ